MKKFERLPPETRKQEIQAAALKLFSEKGFANTTMENIVEQVSLSKGGVYRLYSSTSAILADLMLAGMRLRNAYYEKRVQQEIAAGRILTLPFLVEMIGDSMLLYPEISTVYVEFLWEKQRSRELEALYGEICRTTMEETLELIRRYGAESLLLDGKDTLVRLTEIMNATILSLRVLGMQQEFERRKTQICSAITQILLQEQ